MLYCKDDSICLQENTLSKLGRYSGASSRLSKITNNFQILSFVVFLLIFSWDNAIIKQSSPKAWNNIHVRQHLCYLLPHNLFYVLPPVVNKNKYINIPFKTVNCVCIIDLCSITILIHKTGMLSKSLLLNLVKTTIGLYFT